MSLDDGVSAEMRRLLSGLWDDPSVLDDDSADRLLAGRMDPADAPPGYAGAATVMAAATAPAGPGELDGLESALHAYRAALAARPSPPRRPYMLVKLLTVKAAVAVFTGALLVGGVAAAATGSLPDAAQRVVDRVVGAGQATAGDKGQDLGDAARTEATSQGQGSGEHGQAGAQGTSTGPDLSKIDKTGLCTAYMAGKGGDNGGKYDAAAFKALEQAAGGADKVAEFCKDATASAGASQDQAQQAGGSADDHAQDAGQGQGAGQQPTATGAGSTGGAANADQGQGGGGQR